MTLKTFRYFQNVGGLNLRFNELMIADSEAEEVMNLHATSSGSWTTINVGYVPLNAFSFPDSSEIHSMTEWISPQGDSVFLVGAGQYYYSVQVSDGSFSSISGTAFSGRSTNFSIFQEQLIGCNGVDPPFRWNGSGMISSLPGWAPVIIGVTPGSPSIVEIFSNRLVFSGDSQNPSLVYLSALEDPEVFSPTSGSASAYSIQVSPGDGDRVTALKTMYLPAQNEEILVIFKEKSTYILTGSDTESFALQKISDEFGCVSARSVVQVGNDLMFLSREGITTLSTATAQGNIVTTFISSKIQAQINTLNLNQLSNCFAVHLRNRQEVWWAVPDGGSVKNQRILVLNYGLGNVWSRRSGIEASCGMVYQGKLYTGSYDGFIYQQLKGSSYAGQPISWTYRTPFYDFGAPRTRKRIRDVEIYLKQISQLSITLKSAWDIKRGYLSQESQVLDVIPDASSSVFGTGVYGQDSYGLSGLSILRFIPNGSGQFFQMEFSSTVAEKPVEIQGWTITAMYGGDR